MWTYVSLERKVDPSSATDSSSLLKLDNGKVFLAAKGADDQTKRDGIVASRFEPGLVFYGSDEPFDQGDAAVLTNGTEALNDLPGFQVLAPCLELVGLELLSLVGDEILDGFGQVPSSAGLELQDGHSFARG